MSDVLTSFVNPNLGYLRALIQEELKPVLEELRKTKEELRQAKKDSKSSFIELLEEDQDFKEYVTGLLTPEINKRIQMLEVKTGVLEKDFLDEYTETIPERIEKLEAHVFTESTQKTKNEKRADFFVKVIPHGKITPSHDREIKTKEFREWIANLPEDLKAKSNTNLRKLKSDFFKLLEKLYPDKFLALQDGHGNKEWKLITKSVT